MTEVWFGVGKRWRDTFSSAKDSGAWSGNTFEELLLETPEKLELLHSSDNLVDGRFELAKRNLNLQFRGSSNQRIIYVPKSLAAGKAVIWEKCHDAETSYEQIKKSI